MSIVAAVGFGPVILAAATDLVPGATPGPVLASVFVLAVGAAALGILLLGSRHWAHDATTMPSTQALLSVFGVALLVSSVGWMLVNVTDAANTSAWRHSQALDPGAGISARIRVEERLHFSRLTPDGSSESTDEIADLAVSWPVWLTGGTVDFLLRVAQPGDAGEGPSCGTGRATVRAVSAGELFELVDVPIRDLCGTWQRVEVLLPRKVTRITFELLDDSDAMQSGPGLDVSVLRLQPGLRLLWALSTIVAFSLALTLAYLAVTGANDSARPATRDAVTRRQDRREFAVAAGVAIVFFLIVSNIFVFWFVSQEKTIYTWDNAGYWTSSRHVSDVLRGESSTENDALGAGSFESSEPQSFGASARPTLPQDPLTSLVRNVRYSEYNISNNIPVAAVMVVFGGSRLVYELSLTNVYALAAVLVLVFALRSLAVEPPSQWVRWWTLIPVLIVLCFAPFWVPLVRGYIGICVVAVNLAVLWLYFKRRSEPRSVVVLTSIGLLLVAGVLLQRWNAYWVVAFLLITIVDGARRLLEARRFDIGLVLRCFQDSIIVGSVALLTLATVAWPLVVTMATTDYADIYSAYAEHTSLLSAIAQLTRSFGLVLLLFVVSAAGYLIWKPATRWVALLLSLQLVVMFVHMSGTQTMGPHHLYILMPGMLLLLSIAIIDLVSARQRRVAAVGAVILALFFVNGAISGVAVFAPSGDPVRAMLIPLVPDNRRIPLVRDDLDAFDRLTAYIDDSVTSDPEITGIYVLSSSQTLNVVHLRNLEASTGLEFRSVDRLLRGSEVDKRDGFPRGLLAADLVIVADPIQYNRRPTDQYVVGIPAQAMLESRGIGAAFRQLPVSFKFRDGVDVLIFRRIREHTPLEISGFSNELREIYPDRPKIYQ